MWPSIQSAANAKTALLCCIRSIERLSINSPEKIDHWIEIGSYIDNRNNISTNLLFNIVQALWVLQNLHVTQVIEYFNGGSL